MRDIIPLSEAMAEAGIGAKAYTLALLHKSHFPVPKGFIIAAQAFRPLIQHDINPSMWIFAESLRFEIMEAYRTL